MTSVEFLRMADSVSAEMLTNRPADVDRILARNLDIDKNLATSVLCFGDAYSVKDDAWSWFQWARDRREGRDVIATYASERLAASAASFRNCYACADTAGFLDAASGVMRLVGDPDEMAQVAYAVCHYMILFYYWVDTSVPWAELSPGHAQLVRDALV